MTRFSVLSVRGESVLKRAGVFRTAALFAAFLAAVVALAFQTETAQAGDTRVSSKRFAKSLGIKRRALEASFSSVGEIKCGRHVATANLIGNNRTIITAAHVFRFRPREVRSQICKTRKGRSGLKFLKCRGRIAADMRVEAEIAQRLGNERWRRDTFYSNGRKRKRPAACRFTHTVFVKGRKVRRSYRVDPRTVQFASVPKTSNAFELMSRDWALARLTRPARHAQPIAVPHRREEAIGENRLLASIKNGEVETLGVQVTNASMKFRKRNTRARQLYQRCGMTVAVRRRYMSGGVFLADCFAEPGSSGSLVVQPRLDGKGYVARGMIVAIDRRQSRTKGKNKFQFGGTYGIVMERAFAQSVRTYIETGRPTMMPVARRLRKPAG